MARTPVLLPAGYAEASAQATVLAAGLGVDRTAFDMTWSPLHMASVTAHGAVRTRFVRT